MANMVNPYPDTFRLRRKIKANFHTHSKYSDGRLELQRVIDLYSRLQYKVLMISDHDVFGGFVNADNKGLTLIPGVEVSDGGPHMLQVGIGDKIKPDPDRQAVIDAINNAGGYAIMNHPKWEPGLNHWPVDVLLKLRNYLGIEIINGNCYHDAGSAEALDVWDAVLSAGKRIWGMGNDDCHFTHDVGICWNTILTDDPSPRGILHALKRGSFYVSTGIEINNITMKNKAIVVTCRDADIIVAIGEHGCELAYGKSGSITFDVEKIVMPYVRFECYGRGRKRAFTQPFFNQDSLSYKPVPKTTALRIADVKSISDIKTELWQKGAAVTEMISVKKGVSAEDSTRFCILYDRKNIYIKALCYEPDTSKLEKSRTRSIYSDDSVEFFFDPGRTCNEYYQIVVNAAGNVEVLKNTPHTLCTIKGLVIKAALKPRRYEIALSIPFKSITAAYPAHNAWGLNFIRNRTGLKRDSYVWSWTGTYNHLPSRFGVLEFDQ
ncbi:MAG: hypothetical protein A2487_14520 [Candidatus Raymondbacteria bacterium RifOxyC12_full_50_8]|uniref:Polymerase/histidinol phosphatase N-terminal domain-containing protein n=1 Tax=Candidatus Raymondbacteria bacterium RIFOXYD12_FULL_49_13 TaxID=1817890 RepID=A0A1F7F6C3_UNCRA|nr:MAG: hypothetical protein A2248_03470 [Candidatus Raymondbacteria bacterium RIFOXYA2_FULL_49_16]OGJ99637.1 MAG: hypothetical protein A2350_16125 [Candidatus Raymondbacteria bacterium RifOxyB12_full_50_8]OGK02128.1 MAG: hypothetical protein A2519_18885 [Candidatus Raymondbacteria bacterium RIFOXYD12_FULL_49_13]OGK06857.1 MAG: hypothetical protein A2487_14520 [Candidatus Raymondbacteria bacterium RifOxyC12_full_50_8]OGP42513.1 MAG: hypothetical protein A2324_17505 [Candidatus Raymondbacteria b